MLNARNIPVIRADQGVEPWSKWGISNASVGIVAPAFLNMQDLQAGACKPQYLCFNNSYWAVGGSAKNPPGLTSPISAFFALDQLLDQLFLNSTFPQMKQVVLAGHSLGGQGVQRYAILKKTKAYDPNVRYWIGNPGAWTWLTHQRPTINESAKDTFDTWPYGIHQNVDKIPIYARRDVKAKNGTLVAERFRSRNVGYFLSLMDVGAGAKSPQAMCQGVNHLDRGSRFVISLSKDFGTEPFPPNHTADFAANVTHVDYAGTFLSVSLYAVLRAYVGIFSGFVRPSQADVGTRGCPLIQSIYHCWKHTLYAVGILTHVSC